MGDELKRARTALDAGSVDEALVLLWMALEPARLAGDKEALAEIAQLAASIPRREATVLLAATGVGPVAPTAEQQPARHESIPRRLLPGAIWALLIAGLIAFSALRTGSASEPDSPPRVQGIPARIPIDADGLFLVPLARYPQADLTDVGLSVIREAGAVDIRSPLGLGPRTYDEARGQFVAEELLRRLTEAYEVIEGRKTLIVGVTSHDVYERGAPSRPHTSVARTADGHFVVVSTHALGSDVETRKAGLRRALLAEIRGVGLKPA